MHVRSIEFFQICYAWRLIFKYWREKITLEMVNRKCLMTLSICGHLPVLGSQKTQAKHTSLPHWCLSLSHSLCTVPLTPTLPLFQMFWLIAFPPRNTASAQHEHMPRLFILSLAPLSSVILSGGPCMTKLRRLRPGWRHCCPGYVTGNGFWPVIGFNMEPLLLNISNNAFLLKITLQFCGKLQP